MTINLDLLHAADAADTLFHNALVNAYGKARAGDMRYRYAHPGHPEVEEAARVFQAAADAWLEEMRRSRES